MGDLVQQALSDSAESAGESEYFWLPTTPAARGGSESTGFPESLEGVG
jgi:hypothetical protein